MLGSRKPVVLPAHAIYAIRRTRDSVLSPHLNRFHPGSGSLKDPEDFLLRKTLLRSRFYERKTLYPLPTILRFWVEFI